MKKVIDNELLEELLARVNDVISMNNVDEFNELEKVGKHWIKPPLFSMPPENWSDTERTICDYQESIRSKLYEELKALLLETPEQLLQRRVMRNKLWIVVKTDNDKKRLLELFPSIVGVGSIIRPSSFYGLASNKGKYLAYDGGKEIFIVVDLPYPLGHKLISVSQFKKEYVK